MKRSKFQYWAPTLGEIWGMVAVLLGAMIFAGIVTPPIIRAFPFLNGVFESLSYAIGMAIPLTVAWLIARSRMKAGAKPLPLDASDFGGMTPARFAIVSTVALVSLSVVLEPATAFIPMPESVKDMFEKAFKEVTLLDGILATCILAPICEELFCRALAMRGILACGGSAVKAILWSAFIFAFIHLNPWQSIPAFVIGVFFGWIYLRTGSLTATVFLHFANNAISTLLTRLFPEMGMDEGLIDILPTGLYIVIYIAAAALLFAAISALNRKLPKKCTKSSTL